MPPVVLFDGVCNLCNGSVQWIIRRDRRGRFRFAALQSEAGRSLLRRAAEAAAGGDGPEGRALRLAAAPEPETIVLIADGRVMTHSGAVLGIARRMGLPWSLCAAGLVIPRPLRDAIYRGVARRRYRWFGRTEACMVPTPALRARFLPDPPRGDHTDPARG